MGLISLKKNTLKRLLLADDHKILKEHLIYILLKMIDKNIYILKKIEIQTLHLF